MLTKALPIITLVCAATLSSAMRFESSATQQTDAATSAQIYEQRVYTTAEGKLPALHARFRDHTNQLFVKHGMRLIGYWTPIGEPNTLIYILAHEDKNAAERSWKSFMADEQWQKVWEESKANAGGKIVTKVESTYMNPTDYSPLR